MSIGATFSPWGLWEPPLLLPPTHLRKNKNYRQTHLFENKHMQDAKLCQVMRHSYIPYRSVFPQLSQLNRFHYWTPFLGSRVMSPQLLQSVSQDYPLHPIDLKFATKHGTSVYHKPRNHSNQHFQVLHTCSYCVFLQSRICGKIHVQWNEKAI